VKAVLAGHKVIAADDFLGPARERGFNFFTGVPCSFLTPLINGVIGDPKIDYVGAASEGEAVAIGAGAWLAGRNTVVMCQNSGLGNAVNPLTSLNFPFRIPTLMIVTWRGQPGLNDEPQHELMGQITRSLLDLIAVPHRPFPRSPDEVGEALDEAVAEMARTGLPYAFVLDKGAVGKADLCQPPPPARLAGRFEDLRHGGKRPSRMRALECFLETVPDTAAVIATTGKCGRELFTLADRPQQLYQVGSMGGASAMGLGVALNTERPVVILDGDGAALMKLGSLATIGAAAPANLTHILLDNGVHDSTGGQNTVSSSVDFARVALACGYSYATACDEIGGFEKALKQAFGAPGPSLLHLRIAPGSIDKLGRPTIGPEAVARRFKEFITKD
jgi:phosphonopyruvate decarboxylase